MALPAIGDGEYLDRGGNSNEAALIGLGTRTVKVCPSGAGSFYIGGSSSALVGFFGKTPVVQRPYTASVHATSALASSTDFAAAQTAIVKEIMLTLIGLGIYATA